MSKGKEKKRKREGKGREREAGDDVDQFHWGEREKWMVGTGGKKKGNLSTKYVADSECIKNI